MKTPAKPKCTASTHCSPIRSWSGVVATFAPGFPVGKSDTMSTATPAYVLTLLSLVRSGHL